jgi:hypothetical protein
VRRRRGGRSRLRSGAGRGVTRRRSVVRRRRDRCRARRAGLVRVRARERGVRVKPTRPHSNDVATPLEWVESVRHARPRPSRKSCAVVTVLTDSAGWADQGDVRGRVVGVPIRRLGWPVVDRAGASADRADIPGFQPAVVDAAIPTAGFASADASGDLSPERFPARARTHRLADRQAILGGVARWEATHRDAMPMQRLVDHPAVVAVPGALSSNGSTCVSSIAPPSVSHRSHHQQRHPAGYRPTSHPPGLYPTSVKAT